MGHMKNACRIVVRKSEVTRSFLRQGHGWENNIKISLKETVCGGVDWIKQTQENVQ
jgi:hypothetical protein